MQITKGVYLTIITAIISGLAIFINQFGVQVISSDIYTFLKNLVAGILVVAVFLLFKERQGIKKLMMKDLGLLALIGLIGGSIPFILFFKGLAMSAAGNGSLIHKTIFLFVAALAAIFLKEKLNKWLIGGMTILLIGNVFLLKFNTNVILNRGDLLILLATVLWAIENIISKKAVGFISPRIVAASRMLFGCVFIMLYLLITGQFSQLGHLNISQLSWVWLTGVLLTGYVLTWYSGIKYLNISTATCLLALGAPITTLLTLIQGKTVAVNQYIGGALLLIGVICVLKNLKVNERKNAGV